MVRFGDCVRAPVMVRFWGLSLSPHYCGSHKQLPKKAISHSSSGLKSQRENMFAEQARLPQVSLNRLALSPPPSPPSKH